MQREAQARAMARKEVQSSPSYVACVCAVEPFECCVTLFDFSAYLCTVLTS